MYVCRPTSRSNTISAPMRLAEKILRGQNHVVEDRSAGSAQEAAQRQAAAQARQGAANLRLVEHDEGDGGVRRHGRHQPLDHFQACPARDFVERCDEENHRRRLHRLRAAQQAQDVVHAGGDHENVDDRAKRQLREQFGEDVAKVHA